MRSTLALPVLLLTAALIAGCADAVQLEAELNTTRAELTTLRRQHAQTVAALASVRRLYEGQKSSHIVLGQTINQRDEQILTLTRDVRDRDQVIGVLRSAEARLQVDVKSLEAERDQLQKLVASYVVQLEADQAKIARLTAAMKQVPTAPPPLPAPAPE